LITNFAGLRAKGANRDFVIGEVADVPGFFNIACFESPGLTSAPAVAVDMAERVAASLGASKRADFNPRRARSGHKLFAQMSDEERAAAIADEPEQGEIVCRCCEVSRGDLVYEFKSALPVLCLDALKWRTGAMMGRCHAGFCSPEIMRIMHQYTGLLPEQMDKRLPGSPFVAESSEEYAHPLSFPRERESIAATHDSLNQYEYDVLVIGAGAAGMAAAVAAREEGVERVALLDREHFLGGILRQCIHNGFGLTRFKRELTGPEYAIREEAALAAQGVDLLLNTTVLSINPGAMSALHEVCAAGRDGLMRLKAKTIVLATGSRERGLGALNLAGSRPAGVFSAGSAQNLINLEGCLPGRKVIIQGSGDIGLIMARRCLYAGAEVLGVFARSSKPSGLSRNVRQCLDDYNIPFYGNRVATRIEGEGRLSAVWISAVDPVTKLVIEGSEQRWECDTLLLSIGLLPENELAAAAGIAMDKSTGGPITDAWLQTSVPGIFACGNALHIHDLADNASEEGELAGCTAARTALGLGSEPSLPFPRIQEHDTVLKDMAPPPVGNGSKPCRDASTPSTPSTSNTANNANTPNTPNTLTLVCVRCPKGCELQLALTPDGALAEVQGEGCRLGLAYAEEEVTAPKRIVTASLGIAGSLEPLSVKTAAPVLRTHIFAVLDEIRALKLRVPIQAGTKLVENIANTGVALVATKTLPADQTEGADR
jgi:CxxC motif-containing protein/pyruvate/2-oxoglutarate dehydrogenase complex dihydrolipoamide dehydrogenase (E3) component